MSSSWTCNLVTYFIHVFIVDSKTRVFYWKTQSYTMYITHKIHTKLHLGPEWHIFHILTGEDSNGIISCFFTVVCWNSQFVYSLSRWLEDMNFHFILILKTIFHSVAALLCKLLFLPLKTKILVFALSSNLSSMY